MKTVTACYSPGQADAAGSAEGDVGSGGGAGVSGAGAGVSGAGAGG